MACFLFFCRLLRNQKIKRAVTKTIPRIVPRVMLAITPPWEADDDEDVAGAGGVVDGDGRAIGWRSGIVDGDEAVVVAAAIVGFDVADDNAAVDGNEDEDDKAFKFHVIALGCTGSCLTSNIVPVIFTRLPTGST